MHPEHGLSRSQFEALFRSEYKGMLYFAIRYVKEEEAAKEIVQEAGQLEVPKLERRLPMLATIAYVAPLVGLLGTVTGMIDAFTMLSTSAGGVATMADISTGVYKSLLTTAAGLVVAIPTSLALSFLSSRVNTLMHDMERAGIEIVNMITDRPSAPAEPLARFGDRKRAAGVE